MSTRLDALKVRVAATLRPPYTEMPFPNLVHTTREDIERLVAVVEAACGYLEDPIGTGSGERLQGTLSYWLEEV